MVRPILAVLTLLAATPALAPALAQDGQPQPGDLRLGYAVYVGGLHMLDATAHLGMAPDRYRIGLQAATDGFLGRVADWRTDVLATGRLGQGALPKPDLYRSVGAWRSQPRNTTLTYDADGVPALTVAEPKPEDDREPVPDSLRPHTLDPLSAMVAALVSVAAGKDCGVTVPVYDGRQRYDLSFLPRGDEVLQASDLSSFAGPAKACGLDYKPLAGRWKEQDSRRDRDERQGRSGRGGDVTFWLAPPRPGAPPVPVKMQADSPLGPVLVHLARVEIVGRQADATAASGP